MEMDEKTISPSNSQLNGNSQAQNEIIKIKANEYRKLLESLLTDMKASTDRAIEINENLG